MFDPQFFKTVHPPRTTIQDYVEEQLRAELEREESFCREYAPPLIACGYRWDEIELQIERKWMHPSMDVLHIGVPTHKRLSPEVLFLRRLWRKFFPYKMPEGWIKNA